LHVPDLETRWILHAQVSIVHLDRVPEGMRLDSASVDIVAGARDAARHWLASDTGGSRF
jgi:hypothetical protein